MSNSIRNNLLFGVFLAFVVFSFSGFTGLPADSVSSIEGIPGQSQIDQLNMQSASELPSSVVKALFYAEKALTAAEHIGYQNGQAEAFYNLGQIYRNKQDYLPAIDAYSRACSVFRETQNWKETIRILNILGVLSDNVSENEKALDYFQQALDLSRQYRYRDTEAEALFNIGNIYRSTRQFEQAERFYRNALAIGQELDNKAEMAAIYLHLGNLNRLTSNYEEALEFYTLSRDHFDKAGDQVGLTQVLHETGIFYGKTENYPAATDCFRHALDISLTLNNRREQARNYDAIGLILFMQGNPEQALNYHNTALDIYIRLQDKAGVASVYNNIGDCHFERGRYVQSNLFFQKALDIRTELGGYYGIAETAYDLGRVNKQLEQYAIAVNYFNQSLNLARSEKLRELVLSNYSELADVYEKSGRPALALRYYKEFTALRDSITEAKTGKRIAELLIMYQKEKINKELAQLKKDKVIQENLIYFYIVVAFLALIIGLIYFVFYYYKNRTTRFWHTAIDSLTHPFFVFNARANKIYLANKSGRELLEKNQLSVTRPDFAVLQNLPLLVDQIYHSGQSVTVEKSFMDGSGNLRFIEIHGFPVFNESRQVSQVIEYLIDISERKQAEAEILDKNTALKASRDEYKRVISAIPDAIWSAIIDAEGQIFDSFYSQVIEKITGYPATSLDGAKNIWSSIVHPEDLVKLRSRNKDLIASGMHANEMEYRIVRKDGRLRYVKSSVTLTDLGYNRFRIDGILTDITEKKRAENLLEEEKERLSVTLGSIAEGVITTDTDGRVQYLNRVAEQLTGWSYGGAVGMPLEYVLKLIDEKSRLVCENPVRRIMEARQVVHFEEDIMLASRNGKTYQIAYSGAPIKREEAIIIGVVIVFRDVSEKRRLQDDLQKIRKLEAIGILAGGIAHDFNNILTAIIGNISLAKLFCDPGSKTAIRLGEAEKASFRAKELTQQLLTFSKGGAPVKKTASLSELLQEAANFTLTGSNVRCEFELAPDLWLSDVDEGQISQVIYNLTINAKQAMPNGGLLKITAANFSTSENLLLPLSPGKYIKIDITDHGVGIPEEHLIRIFDPYFTTKQEGSGLGLAICHSIVLKHEGYITVESEPGKGTTFTFYLPASVNDTVIKQDEVQLNVRFTGNVLLMDDESDIREVASEMLGLFGLKVTLAKHGQEALELYRSGLEGGERFNLVILDLTVPGGMGGKETISALRRIDPEVRAIVTSGYSTDTIMSDYKRFGFIACMAKPYKMSELSEALKTALYDDAEITRRAPTGFTHSNE
jgi:PAS domain S-box-containing protein